MASESFHADSFTSLLRRQIRHFLKTSHDLPKEWQVFLRSVDRAYRQADAERIYLRRLMHKSHTSEEGEAKEPRQEQRLQLLARAVNEAVWDWDLLSDHLWTGPGVCSLFGYFTGEVKPEVGWWQERVHPEDRARVMGAIQDSIQHGVYFWSQEYRFRCADGFYANVQDRGYVLTNDFGKPIRAIWATTDISPFKTLEGKVRISERMASMGQLMAGVVHELNKPLTIILGMTQIHLKRLVENDALKQGLGTIEREVRRCQHLVQQLLGFSRDRGIQRDWVRFTDIVEQALSLVEFQAEVLGIHIERHFAEGLAPIQADSGQIQQVVINLCSNALEAMQKGQQLRVIVDEGETPDGVRLRVIDQGQGISPELGKRLFEPFFTTKEPGKGTGLGLSIVKDIVEAHGGRIEITSKPGQGTTFMLWFPRGIPSQKQPAEQHAFRLNIKK
jgi:signal transduction histidine kinase